MQNEYAPVSYFVGSFNSVEGADEAVRAKRAELMPFADPKPQENEAA